MKKIVVGVIIGFVLAFAASAYADEIESLIGKKIEGEFPVTINGQRLDKKAIVIDGTSYLPVRAIADAVYQNVYFDADLGITLTSKGELSLPEVQPGTEPAASKDDQISDVRTQIKEIEGRIVAIENSKKRLIEAAKLAGTGDPDFTISDAKISDLQAQKADLEAQLAALEAQQ